MTKLVTLELLQQQHAATELKALAAEGIGVVSVESYTGSPEVMDGRVKTLHPRVHGGILMRGPVDEGDLDRLGGKPIDLVAPTATITQESVEKDERCALASLAVCDPEPLDLDDIPFRVGHIGNARSFEFPERPRRPPRWRPT